MLLWASGRASPRPARTDPSAGSASGFSGELGVVVAPADGHLQLGRPLRHQDAQAHRRGQELPLARSRRRRSCPSRRPGPTRRWAGRAGRRRSRTGRCLPPRPRRRPLGRSTEGRSRGTRNPVRYQREGLCSSRSLARDGSAMGPIRSRIRASTSLWRTSAEVMAGLTGGRSGRPTRCRLGDDRGDNHSIIVVGIIVSVAVVDVKVLVIVDESSAARGRGRPGVRPRPVAC